jgi:hypothetical protein
MQFHISGLPIAPFSQLFGLPTEELAQKGIVRCIVDKQPGFPCRVSLRDAELGETVLLLNYEHLNVASPYRSRHAIYVREAAVDAKLGPGEIPEVLRLRLLSVRAFDDAGMMVAADVVAGSELESVIAQMFANQNAAYLHVHNAKPGCFAARIDRWPR